MARHDPSSAECIVLTFKEGLLSAIAHDLQIRVRRFEIDVDDTTHAITARFEAGSLSVVTAMHDGEPRPETLSDADKRKIEQNIATDVLDVRSHPDILFRSSEVSPEGEGYRVRGDLTLHGRTRPIGFLVEKRDDRLVTEIRIHQPDFGIKPYSAMLGTLKVKPDVIVRCSIPAR